MASFTRDFEHAIAEASTLSPQEQDALAALILAEINDRRRWDELLVDGRSPALLERLASEAIAEDEAGQTEPLEILLAEEDGDRSAGRAR
jgi:hypothetical protein